MAGQIEIELALLCGGFFHPILHSYKEICISPKIRVLSSGTMLQTVDFAMACQSLQHVVSLV